MWLLDELTSSDRLIVTNEHLVFDGIIAYLHKIGRHDIDVYSRIRIIDFDEVKEFWRFRSIDPSEDHPPITPDQIKEGVRPSKEHFSRGGVYYLLSELHRHLNSRQWRETGPLILDYISMHRHYGDDVVWVSQAPENVDKQWKSVTADWTLVRNYGKESFRGFRKGSYFEWRTYLVYDENENANCQENGTFKVDASEGGAARCYKTSEVGGKADMGRKSKGLHIWWLYGGAIGIMALVALGFMFVPDLAAKRLVAKTTAEKQQKKEEKEQRREGLVRQSSAVTPGYLSGGTAIVAPTPEPKPFHVVAVPLKFSAADTVLGALSKDNQVSPGGTITITPNADNTSVIVSGDDPQKVVGLAEVVRRYDRECATIAVHCVIARRQLGESSQMGLFALWEDVAAGRDQGSLSAALEALAVDLSTGVSTMGAIWTARQALEAFVQFVESDSRFHVMSHPCLVVASGKAATFSSGREIPVPTTVRDASGSQTSIEYKRAEFSFEVKPTLLESGRIVLEIKQQNSDVIGTAVIAGSQIPTLSTQDLKSSVTLNDRQLLYLGGIVVETASSADRGTPGLRKVPVVNWFFGRSETVVDRSELFVMLCAEVYREEGPVRVERAEPVNAL